MVHECLRPEAAGSVAALPEADSRHRAAMDCPRCRVLLRGYAEFMAAEVATNSRPELARQEISKFVRQRLTAANSPGSAGRRNSMVRSPRTLYALAAVLVLGFGITQWQGWDRPQPRLERSDSSARFAAPIVAVAADTVNLSWQVDPFADSYTVVLMDEELSELRQFGPMTQTELSIPIHQLGLGSQQLAFAWQVRSLRSGAILHRSEPAFMELR